MHVSKTLNYRIPLQTAIIQPVIPLKEKIVTGLDALFDKIFIINLDKRTDRWEKCLAEIEKTDITNYERVSATCLAYSEIDQKIISNFSPRTPRKNKPYLAGSYSCKMSHYRVVQMAKERGYSKILIFEDDFLFCPSFETEIKRIPQLFDFEKTEWELFYFGANTGDKKETFPAQVVKAPHVLTAHAYAIHSRAFGTILDKCMKFPAEIDVFYKSEFKQVYVVKPSIVTQRSSFSDIQGIIVNYDNLIK